MRFKDGLKLLVKTKMGLVRLRIRELAQKKGWTLKEVADRSDVPYSTVRSYVCRDKMAMIDYATVQKMLVLLGWRSKIWSRFWKSRVDRLS